MYISDISNVKTNDEIGDIRGWVDTIRHHGGLLFFELRDHDSKVQVVTDKPDDFESIKNEYYVSVSGSLIKRKKENINSDEQYGDIVQIQGDHRKDIVNFLETEKICSKDQIIVHGF